MTAVTIRPARAEDVPLIRDLKRTIVEASLPIVGEVRSIMSSKDAVGASVEDALQLAAVAAEGSRPPETGVIGMIALTVRTGDVPSHRTCTSAHWQVAEPYRRQGIAMRLVQEAGPSEARDQRG